MVAVLAASALWYLPAGLPEFRFANLFTDHVVLQRETQAPVWGFAKPGAQVEVHASWMKAPITTTADSTGRWMVKLRTGKAGGPHTLTAKSGEETVKIKDVLLGEVWLMSGQSNMEWQVGWSAGCHPTLNHDQVRADANHPDIRYFFVPKSMTPQPAIDIDSTWKIVSPQTVDGCSAVAYYFARKLKQELGVPVGLINCAYGGSEIEQWLSDSAMRRIPTVRQAIEIYEEAEVPSPGPWHEKLSPSMMPEKTHKFGGYFSQRMLDWGFDGLLWYRAEFTAPAGGDGVLELGPIDWADAVWVNGQKVGSSQGENVLRSYRVQAKPGRNEVTIAVLDVGSAVGGLADGTRPKVHLKTGPVMLQNWEFALGTPMAQLSVPKIPVRRWSRMRHAMLDPIVPYAVRGFGWYQGESNVGRGYQYAALMREMIADWRRSFGKGKPFCIIQISPFEGYGGSGVSADVREAQAIVGQEKGNGLVVTTDLVDDIKDIHPRNKLDVGNRFAMWALHDVYGRTQFVRSGPAFESARFENGRAIVDFRYAEGLKSRDGKELTGFEVAGADQNWIPARARIRGSRVEVEATAVPTPVAVRYCWSDTAMPNLANGAGLPAIPFRSDRWARMTAKERW